MSGSSFYDVCSRQLADVSDNITSDTPLTVHQQWTHLGAHRDITWLLLLCLYLCNCLFVSLCICVFAYFRICDPLRRRSLFTHNAMDSLRRSPRHHLTLVTTHVIVYFCVSVYVYFCISVFLYSFQMIPSPYCSPTMDSLKRSPRHHLTLQCGWHHQRDFNVSVRSVNSFCCLCKYLVKSMNNFCCLSKDLSKSMREQLLLLV